MLSVLGLVSYSYGCNKEIPKSEIVFRLCQDNYMRLQKIISLMSEDIYLEYGSYSSNIIICTIITYLTQLVTNLPPLLRLIIQIIHSLLSKEKWKLYNNVILTRLDYEFSWSFKLTSDRPILFSPNSPNTLAFNNK